MRFNGRVIQIDTGMQPEYMQDGHASALEIKGGEATAIYADRRDTMNLLKRPGASDDARNRVPRSRNQEPGTRKLEVPVVPAPGA
jgi:hypothetical protein